MNDTILEVWLRLLALHVEDPTDDNSLACQIRNQWLLASRGWCTGCVPHGLEDATATNEGCTIVRKAIDSLMWQLEHSPPFLDSGTLNLLGIEGTFTSNLETSRFIDVGKAFIDLLDDKITSTVQSTDFMPGSMP